MKPSIIVFLTLALLHACFVHAQLQKNQRQDSATTPFPSISNVRSAAPSKSPTPSPSLSPSPISPSVSDEATEGTPTFTSAPNESDSSGPTPSSTPTPSSDDDDVGASAMPAPSDQPEEDGEGSSYTAAYIYSAIFLVIILLVMVYAIFWIDTPSAATAADYSAEAGKGGSPEAFCSVLVGPRRLTREFLVCDLGPNRTEQNC